MKNIAFIILLLTALNLNAQHHFVGIKGGLNNTNVKATNFFDKNYYRTAVLGGLTYEYLFLKHFTIGADLLYVQRGFRNDVTFTDNVGNSLGITRIRYNYDYVSLPVKIGFTIGSKLYAFANIGICPSYLVSAKTIFPMVDSQMNIIGENIVTNTKDVTRFDWAAIVEAGGGYKINDKMSVYASFAYQHSFTSIDNSTYFVNSKVKHYGMAFSVGVKYALAK